MKNTAKTPTTLGKAGRKYWQILNQSFVFNEQDEPLVTSLCVLVDRLSQIREQIEQQGIVTKDRFGIDGPNKLLEHERSTALAAGRLWRELGLASAEDTNPTRMPNARGYR